MQHHEVHEFSGIKKSKSKSFLKGKISHIKTYQKTANFSIAAF